FVAGLNVTGVVGPNHWPSMGSTSSSTDTTGAGGNASVTIGDTLSYDEQANGEFGAPNSTTAPTATTQAAATNSPWTGMVDYRQGGFILGGGTFSGTVVGPNGRRGTVTGYIISAGL